MSTETIGMRLFWVELAIIWASLSLFMMFALRCQQAEGANNVPQK